MSGVHCLRTPESDGERLTFVVGARSLTFGDVLRSWRDDPGVREATIAALAATGPAAIFWEMPRLDRASCDAPYECMLLPARGLAMIAPDARAFANKFAAYPDAPVVVFDNLGGDATLIAPRAEAPPSAYGHLLAFIRTAPSAQQHALLRTIAETALALVEARPLWISTSGLGVAWLHVRLDAYPKYYACRRYRGAR